MRRGGVFFHSVSLGQSRLPAGAEHRALFIYLKELWFLTLLVDEIIKGADRLTVEADSPSALSQATVSAICSLDDAADSSDLPTGGAAQRAILSRQRGLRWIGGAHILN